MLTNFPSSLFCPACGSHLSYSTPVTHCYSCTCGKVIRRTETGGLDITAYSVLKESDSLLQPRTTGKWEGKDFVVKGRFRVWLEEAVLNYWTLVFDNGDFVLLEEGYGHFTIMRETDLPDSMQSKRVNEFKHNTQFTTDGSNLFLLQEMNIGSLIEVEGEVFLPISLHRVFFADFSSSIGVRMSLIDWQYAGVKAYITSSYSFDDFTFKNTRTLGYLSKDFTCTQCKDKVTVPVYPYTNCCVCSNCRTTYVLNPQGGFQSGKILPKTITPALAIGAKGTLYGHDYEVVGWVMKQENNSYEAQWREYTLYNPETGFVFLSEFDGHWIFIKERKDGPVLGYESDKELSYKGEPFQLYNSYNHVVKAGDGAFPYNLFDNQQTRALEFISPPEMWIREKNEKEGIHWYHGKHIAAKTIENGFNKEVVLPYKIGVGAVEPKGYISITNLLKGTLVGALLLIAIHSLIVYTKREKVLWENHYEFKDTTNSLHFTTEKFHLDKIWGNIEIELYSPVDNSWTEVAATLVNADNGKEYSLQKGVEYYHGYEDGESWSEGSKTAQAYFTGIPAGNYLLEVDVSRDPNPGSANEFSLKMVYDVPSPRNLLFPLAFLLILAFGKYYLTQFWEKERWSNSNYSPFNEDDDE